MSATAKNSVALAVSCFGLAGWMTGGPPGGGIGVLTGLLLCVAPWWGQPLWVWLTLVRRRTEFLTLAEPVSAPGDLFAGGVRYQDGVAAAAIRVLGRAHQPTLGPGVTANVLDVARLIPLTRQTLGLTVDSLSVVSLGARRRNTGDYPRIYDSILGPAPYAGRRDTWLIVRIRAAGNAEALRYRTTIGAAAVSAAQRIAAELRHNGIRAQVAGPEDILDLDGRVGYPDVRRRGRRWHAVRGGSGWLTTYGYAPEDVDSAVLEQVWSLPADGVIQNVTVFPDGTATAAVTLRTPQAPTASPSLRLRTLPGRQAPALAANLCAPRPRLPGLVRGVSPTSVVLPIGPSGVLLGRARRGDRLLLPLSDPAGPTRVQVLAADAVANRLMLRLAASGERVSLHTKDFQRWRNIHVDGVTVTDQHRAVAGTTVSVLDGTVNPAGTVDVLIRQTGPATVLVTAAGQVHEVDVEMFRAENSHAPDGRIAA